MPIVETRRKAAAMLAGLAICAALAGFAVFGDQALMGGTRASAMPVPNAAPVAALAAENTAPAPLDYPAVSLAEAKLRLAYDMQLKPGTEPAGAAEAIAQPVTAKGALVE